MSWPARRVRALHAWALALALVLTQALGLLHGVVHPAGALGPLAHGGHGHQAHFARHAQGEAAAIRFADPVAWPHGWAHLQSTTAGHEPRGHGSACPPAATEGSWAQWVLHLLVHHEDGGIECRLLDQLAHVDALPILAAAPVASPPAPLHGAAPLAEPDGEARSTVRNRGPPHNAG